MLSLSLQHITYKYCWFVVSGAGK